MQTASEYRRGETLRISTKRYLGEKKLSLNHADLRLEDITRLCVILFAYTHIRLDRYNVGRHKTGL